MFKNNYGLFTKISQTWKYFRICTAFLNLIATAGLYRCLYELHILIVSIHYRKIFRDKNPIISWHPNLSTFQFLPRVEWISSAFWTLIIYTKNDFISIFIYSFFKKKIITTVIILISCTISQQQLVMEGIDFLRSIIWFSYSEASFYPNFQLLEDVLLLKILYHWTSIWYFHLNSICGWCVVFLSLSFFFFFFSSQVGYSAN